MTLHLHRDREPDLVVDSAVLVAEVSSKQAAATRWTELRLWRSGAGQFVAEQVGRSTLEGEVDRCRAWVCADATAVVAKLKHGWLARQIYAKAGIDDAEQVR